MSQLHAAVRALLALYDDQDFTEGYAIALGLRVEGLRAALDSEPEWTEETLAEAIDDEWVNEQGVRRPLTRAERTQMSKQAARVALGRER